MCGKPLIGWPINAARNSIYVDKIIVSTDDLDIAKVARNLGADVPFMRPSELASDTASSYSVIEHAISFMTRNDEFYDYIILLEPTSPTTESSDIDAAMDILTSSRNIADSIVGVAKVEGSHPAFSMSIDRTGLIKPFACDNFKSAGRRQDLVSLYHFDGSLYISDVGTLLKKKTFYHDRTLPYIVPKWKSFEIDDIVDFFCVESIIKNIDTIKGDGTHE